MPLDELNNSQLSESTDTATASTAAPTDWPPIDRSLLGEARPGWRHDLVVRALHALKRCGRHAEGVERAEAGLQAWQDSPDFFFALGDLLLDWAAEQPALQGLEG